MNTNLPWKNSLFGWKKGKLHFGVLIKGKKGQIFEENCKGSVEIIDTEFS